MNENEDLKREIEVIKKYHKSIELERLWEVSLTKRITHFILAYSIISFLFVIIGIDRPLVKAIIPSLVYFLVSASIEIIKKWWIESQK